jgi:hypothetical protein
MTLPLEISAPVANFLQVFGVVITLALLTVFCAESLRANFAPFGLYLTSSIRESKRDSNPSA